MKAYSVDLRQRVVALVDAGEHTQGAVAKLLGVSRRFVSKLLRQRRELGHFSARAHGGGAKAKLSASDHEWLQASVLAQPDATLAELAQALQARGCPAVSAATLCRTLAALDLPRKKRRATPRRPTRSSSRSSAN
jgi:transposase